MNVVFKGGRDIIIDYHRQIGNVYTARHYLCAHQYLENINLGQGGVEGGGKRTWIIPFLNWLMVLWRLDIDMPLWIELAMKPSSSKDSARRSARCCVRQKTNTCCPCCCCEYELSLVKGRRLTLIAPLLRSKYRSKLCLRWLVTEYTMCFTK